MDARDSVCEFYRRMEDIGWLYAFWMSSAFASLGEVFRESFGQLRDGSEVFAFTLKSPSVELKLISYGARVISLKTPDRDGRMGDVALGYDSLEEYLENKNAYLGSIVGRFGNRIDKGQFSIDGEKFQLTLNNGPNSLHGGTNGFDLCNWESRVVDGGVEFTLVSEDGDQGYPGTMTAVARYTLDGDTVRIAYSAKTDKPTVVNLTNHTYFNLGGEGSGLILDEELVLHADAFTPVSATLIPTGELKPVAGTVFDFTKTTKVGERIEAADEQLERAGGYDHNWVVRGKAGEMRPAAEMYDAKTGRVMKVETTEPGIQFYSGNFLDGTLKGKSGKMYVKRSGFCLETQHFPDSPNQKDFPSTVLRPGETYRSETTFSFGVR
jgi:aldose 1-epimerase